jgi:hypothetical protein
MRIRIGDLFTLDLGWNKFIPDPQHWRHGFKKVIDPNLLTVGYIMT